MRTRCLPVIVAILLVGTAAASFAQDRRGGRQRTAILDPAEAGPDFADQGEYAGQVFVAYQGGWRTRPFGLQVAAQGDGQFIASLYAGGLPGAGWDRSERVPLAGARTGAGVVELAGDGFYITLAGGTVRLASTSRQLVGELRKVRRISPTLGLRPPAGAVRLFDGGDTSRLAKARTTPEGLLMEGAEFETPARDFTLHVEFLLPFMPAARGQGRANSGVYLQSRYEVQILDSFALEGAENECAALYRQRRPDVNMCLPPLAWQTYDIDFTSPRFDGEGNKVRHARITVRHNGVLVHDDVEVPAKTGAGSPEGPRLLPTKLQDHRDPVRFRNVWLVSRDPAPLLADAAAVPRPAAVTVIPAAPAYAGWRGMPAARVYPPARRYPAAPPVSAAPAVPSIGYPSAVGYHRSLYAGRYPGHGSVLPW